MTAMTVGANEVKVRMFRQGLGDCFLLAFPTGEGRPFFMLIDCGVILGTSDAADRMNSVAIQIREATGGEVDVLVATHEHWDHLSGFIQAEEVFKSLKVGEVWLAWTEDPNDALAGQLRAKKEAKLKGLRAAVALWRKTNPLAADKVLNVLHFFGDALGPDDLGTADLGAAAKTKKRKASTGEALKSLQEGRKVRFHTPGGPPIRLGEGKVEGVSVYVLGPPRDLKLLRKSDPTKTGREVYDFALAMDTDLSFLAAVEGADVSGEGASGYGDDSLLPPDLRGRCHPFDAKYRIEEKEAKTNPFFAERYGFDDSDDSKWRRIDDDWLGSSGRLALQLDSDTNNTSLAMAIELPDGRVLLFPADAQVGNWLSWQSLTWKREGAGRDDPPVTATDLLNRTVLYKVGHHASHNATLRAKGLELMTHPDLAAMTPVNHAMALKKKWDMPFPQLREALEARSRGRLMLVDEGVPLLDPGADAELSREDLKAFRDRVIVVEDDGNAVGYIEYTLPLSTTQL